MVKIRVCPVCFSTNITLYLGDIAGQLYKCSNRGYIGPIVLVIDSNDLERIQDLKSDSSGKMRNNNVNSRESNIQH